MGCDYYGVLGITRSANDYDVKMAFRKKAIHFNPERNDNPKSKDLFTLICEAYEVLSDKSKKAVYDQYGETGLKRGVVTPAGFVPPYEYDRDTSRTFRNFFGTDSPYADILNTYHLPAQHEINESDAADVVDIKERIQHAQQTHTVAITLEELYRGCLKILSVPVQEIDPCSVQLNRINTHKTLHIKIKPNLPENTVFTFPRASNEFPGTADVLVITKDVPHKIFWREGADLHMKKCVSLKQALTGFSFTVKTLDDRVLHVPITDIITCNQSIKMIKSEGMPLAEEPHRKGDLHIHLSIEYPKALSPDVRKVLTLLLAEDSGKRKLAKAQLTLGVKMKTKAGQID